MKDISSLGILHCRFPMSERVEVNLFEAWVLKLYCKRVSLLGEDALQGPSLWGLIAVFRAEDVDASFR